MNINIKATKTTLTPSMKVFIEDKLTSLEKFLKEEDKLKVEIELDKKHHTGLIFRAEIDIQPKGIYAEARGEDFYSAMDMVVPKIKEQLVKAKDKRVSKLRRARR